MRNCDFWRAVRYWLIDPVARSLEVYMNREEARFVLAGIHEAGQGLISPTLNDLQFEVARLFEG